MPPRRIVIPALVIMLTAGLARAGEGPETAPFVHLAWASGDTPALQLPTTATANRTPASFGSSVFAVGVRRTTTGDLRRTAALFEAGAYLEEFDATYAYRNFRAVGVFAGAGVRTRRLSGTARYYRGSGTFDAEIEGADVSGTTLINCLEVVVRLEFPISPLVGIRRIDCTGEGTIWSPPPAAARYDDRRVSTTFLGFEINGLRLFR